MKQIEIYKIIVLSVLIILILSVFGIIIYNINKDNKENKKGESTEEPSTCIPTEEPSTCIPTEEPSTSIPTEEPSTSIPTENYKGFGKELLNTCENNNCKGYNVDIDPIDNIKNVIKKTLLLEEHLGEKDKYSIDSIKTHFLHCLGLIEEAILLSNKNIKNYPLLEESYTIYQDLFEEWLKNSKDHEYVQIILEKLRAFRKKLMEQYYSNKI